MPYFLDCCFLSPTQLTEPRIGKGRFQWNSPIGKDFFFFFGGGGHACMSMCISRLNLCFRNYSLFSKCLFS